MSQRLVSANALVTVQFLTAAPSTWGSLYTLASSNALTCIDGQAESVSTEVARDTIDVSGVSDPYTQLLPGRKSYSIEISKFVALDLLCKSLAGIVNDATGIKIIIRELEGTSAAETYLCVITNVSWTLGNNAGQIEKISCKGAYHGVTA